MNRIFDEQFGDEITGSNFEKAGSDYARILSLDLHHSTRNDIRPYSLEAFKLTKWASYVGGVVYKECMWGTT